MSPTGVNLAGGLAEPGTAREHGERPAARSRATGRQPGQTRYGLQVVPLGNFIRSRVWGP